MRMDRAKLEAQLEVSVAAKSHRQLELRPGEVLEGHCGPGEKGRKEHPEAIHVEQHLPELEDEVGKVLGVVAVKQSGSVPVAARHPE